MPSEVSDDLSWFDRFAARASAFAGRAPFFSCCVLLIIIWAPTIAFLQFDTWQLVINTITTIITFLMVALVQNTQNRNDSATQHKLNAIAEALIDVLEEFNGTDNDISELKAAIGLEERESS